MKQSNIYFQILTWRLKMKWMWMIRKNMHLFSIPYLVFVGVVFFRVITKKKENVPSPHYPSSSFFLCNRLLFSFFQSCVRTEPIPQLPKINCSNLNTRLQGFSCQKLKRMMSWIIRLKCVHFLYRREWKKKNEIQASRERIISNSFSRDVSGANEIRKLPARRPPCDWLRLG